MMKRIVRIKVIGSDGAFLWFKESGNTVDTYV